MTYTADELDLTAGSNPACKWNPLAPFGLRQHRRADPPNALNETGCGSLG
ncbi:MAG: hypothetical protein ACJAR2_002241 [Ilumatobacter sp.]|jgi:hypothetical protein